MKYVTLIKKSFFFATFAFLATLALISADITVTFIAQKIKVPFKKETAVSQVKKAEEKKTAIADYKYIFDSNIFGAAISDENFFDKANSSAPLSISGEPHKQAPATAVPPPEPPPAPEVPNINLDNYELYGTVIADKPNTDLSLAILLNKSAKSYEIYGLKEYNRIIKGTEGVGSAEVVQIDRNSVDIKVGNDIRTLKIDDKKSGAKDKSSAPRPNIPPASPRLAKSPLTGGKDIEKVGENSYVIDKKFYVDALSSSLMQYQGQIGLAPKMDGENNPIGLEVTRITPNSLFRQAGLKSGDVLRSINGKALNTLSAQDYLKLLEDLKGESNINVDILRNNEPVSIGFEVK